MAKTLAVSQKDLKTFKGSSGNYLVVARKHDVALAIKPEDIKPGSHYGVDGATYFTARVRSLPAGQFFDDNDVVTLNKSHERFGAAWPNIKFSKKSHEYYSAVLGCMLPGTISKEPEKLLESMSDKKLAKQLNAYVTQAVGAENLVLPSDQIIDWLDEVYQAPVKQAIESIEKQKNAANAIKEALGTTMGVFGLEGEIIKKAYQKTSAKPTLADLHEAEDLDPEDNDEIDDDEGEEYDD